MMVVFGSRDLVGLVMTYVIAEQLPVCGRVSQTFRAAALKELVRRYELSCTRAPVRVERGHMYFDLVAGYSHRAGTLAGLWALDELTDRLMRCFEPDLPASDLKEGNAMCRLSICSCKSVVCARGNEETPRVWKTRPAHAQELMHLWHVVLDFVFDPVKSNSAAASFEKKPKFRFHVPHQPDGFLHAICVSLVPAPYYDMGTVIAECLGHCVRIDGYTFAFAEYWVAEE